jgi:hypothetical protein
MCIKTKEKLIFPLEKNWWWCVCALFFRLLASSTSTQTPKWTRLLFCCATSRLLENASVSRNDSALFSSHLHNKIQSAALFCVCRDASLTHNQGAASMEEGDFFSYLWAVCCVINREKFSAEPAHALMLHGFFCTCAWVELMNYWWPRPATLSGRSLSRRADMLIWFPKTNWLRVREWRAWICKWDFHAIFFISANIALRL